MNPFQQLRAARAKALLDGQPAPVAFWWSELLTVDDGEDGPVEIYFNDMIDDWYGISSSMVVEALVAAQGRDLLVHLNSPGGMVFEGLAIHAAFAQYRGQVTMRIEGRAASAASIVMLAADQIEIMPAAMVMIHDAWDVTIGPPAEHQKALDLLHMISDNLAGMYAAKAGGDAADWRALMVAETWYAGQAAVDAGLADTVLAAPAGAEDTAAAASAVARWSGIFAKDPARPAGPPAPLVDLAAVARQVDLDGARDRARPPVPVPAAPEVRPAASLDPTALHTILKGLIR